MNYTLQPWDTLISTTIIPENLQSPTSESLRHLIDLSTAERDKLRANFMENIYTEPKQKKMEFYIQFHQAVLIKMLDRLYRYKATAPELAGFYESLSSHASSVLDFFEDYFGKYFDRTAPVPASYLDPARQDIRRGVAELEKTLRSRPEIDTALSRLLLDNFNAFCEASGCSYNELAYQKDLLKELLELQRIPENIPVLDFTREMLVYMNFNHPAFIFHHLRGILSTLKLAGKTGQLQQAERLLRLQQERPGAALRPYAPAVKASLLLALGQEMANLKNGSAPKNTAAAYPKELVSVPFRGAEIYLLHKSFIDAGGAPQEIYKTLLEKTAGCLGNKTQKGFSAESPGKVQ